MLKNIPTIISPELLKILAEMGHGDEIVLADGNFPAAANAKRLIRMDGHNVSEALRSILKLFPLDNYVKSPVGLMEVVKGDDIIPVIWEDYRRILNESEEKFEEFEFIERFEFYERAKNAFAIVATSELALYANIILKKGVISF